MATPAQRPRQLGPAGTAPSPRLAALIDAVMDEHLSYVGHAGLRTLAQAMADIERDGVPGSVLETGCALGGSAIVLAAAKRPERPMRIYDVFGMIPPPGERDGADVHRRYRTIVAGDSPGLGGQPYYGYRTDLVGEVTASFARHGVPVGQHSVRLVQGLFEDTLVVDGPVALAHLDGDWYESTMTCLRRIWPHVSPGGRLVIDDYDAWSGCRTAVDEYFAGRTDARFERRGKLHIVRTAESPSSLAGTAGRIARDALRRARASVRDHLPSAQPVATPRPPVSPTPGKRPQRHQQIDPGWVTAWSRLAGAVLGQPVTAVHGDVDSAAVDTRITRSVRAHAEAQTVRARFADALAGGVELETAVLDAVAAHAGQKQWSQAWALAEGVARLPGGAHASAMAHALLLHQGRQFARISARLPGIDDRELAQYVPIVAVDAFLSDGAIGRARAVATQPCAQPAAVLVDLAGRFLAFGDVDTAASLVARLDESGSAAPGALDGRHTRSLHLTRGWLARTPKTVPEGSVALAVVDYQSPDQDLTSGNLGDYVQTLAMLGNVVRRRDVRFTGENGLGELATEVQHRVRADLRRDGGGADVHLLDVNREFSSGDDLPDATWMIAFGWHMHPLYDLRYDFPYHPAIRPVFVSFHLNRLAMITDETLDYLRRHGPVGCRDWTTVFLLLSAGVDAFFSGCLTTTVDGLFPARSDVFTGPGVVGAIDIRRREVDGGGRPVRAVSHQADEYRDMSITEGLHAAIDMLGGYQRELSRAVTNRLHGYLPLVALGVPTEFRTRVPGDVRFNGLAGLEPGDSALRAIQDGIRELLGPVLDSIVDGADERAVYEQWRRLTAARVDEAKRAFAEQVPGSDDLEAAEPSLDVDDAVARTLRTTEQYGPHDDVDAARVSDLVLCFDENLATPAAVLVESVLAGASGPVRLTVLGRGLADGYGRWLSSCFPDLPITLLRCDHVDYGTVRRIPGRITVSTMDRLLLPLLLEDVARCVYLDVDTIVLGDIVELAGLDLGDTAFAARASNLPEAAEWRTAVRPLAGEQALEIQRRMEHEHGWDAPALNAGVLVLDLARMRADGFTRRTLGWVERYGFHDQDVLLAYGGPNRAVLDRRWNALPVHEDVADPAIIHWASLGKPWDEELTYAREVWQRFADRLAPFTPDAATGRASTDR